MYTPINVDQNTNDIDQKIRDFMDRKTSPWRVLSDRIAERLAPTSDSRTRTRDDIGYETTHWRRAVPNGS